VLHDAHNVCKKQIIIILHSLLRWPSVLWMTLMSQMLTTSHFNDSSLDSNVLIFFSRSYRHYTVKHIAFFSAHVNCNNNKFLLFFLSSHYTQIICCWNNLLLTSNFLTLMLKFMPQYIQEVLRFGRTRYINKRNDMLNWPFKYTYQRWKKMKKKKFSVSAM
jgi:hypothetical protein